MEKTTKNFGLNLELEKLAQSPKDWKLKGRTLEEIELDKTIIKLNPVKIYDNLPIGELQRGREDYMDCASRAPVNVAETIFNYALAENLLQPENVRWLSQTGYIVQKDGQKKIEFSDRYIAIKSGTTNNGNSLKAPVDAIYQWGLIPKAMLCGNSTMSRSEYLSPSRITSAMEDTGKEFKRRFPVQYYKIYKHQFEKALPTSPVVVAGYAWPNPNSQGIYPAVTAAINHAFMYFALPKYKIFDNYLDYDQDWIKRLAEDYILLEYGFWMVFRQRKLAQSPADGETINDTTERIKPIKKNTWLTFYEFWNAIFKKLSGK